ncbi:retroviral-like aspartic protease family protein [Sediminibacterium sp.]|uniref:retroviral-like aspartic protease family protein n=1 Tax=Sediminibacterium sp. TaxID=1917865 RepID=UPI0025EC51CF|nr:retroviral-like aspartic protease family protein [Sediminibacterium sp.]MBW0179364.1 retroviral-like aspartic protease family protein [Sediminibacterium sp.]
MGLVYATITLINGEELILAKRHLIGTDEIKQMNASMFVNSGAYMMAINETICEQLSLSIKEKRKVQLANGEIAEYNVAGPIEVRFKNRRSNMDALVLPGNNEPLLGAIPMEDMDVLIHPQRQELVVNPEHPYFVQMVMK